jgi:hypothetical protein
MLDPIQYETVTEPGGGSPEAPPPVEPVPFEEPAGEPAEVEQPGEPLPDEEGLLDLEGVYDDFDAMVNQRVQQQLAQMGFGQQQFEQQPGFDQYGQEVPSWDTLTPYDDNFGHNLGLLIRSEIQAANQPMSQAFQQAQAQAEQERTASNVDDMVGEEIARNGDLPDGAREFVTLRAQQLLDPIVQQIGNTQRAHELAIERAAREIRGMLSGAGTAAVTQHENRLGTLAEAHAEPSGTNGAAVPGIPNRIMQPGELARKYGAF